MTFLIVYLIGFVVIWIIDRWQSGPADDWNEIGMRFTVAFFSWTFLIVYLLILAMHSFQEWFPQTQSKAKPPRWL